MSNERKLLRLKQDIEEAEEKASKLEGKKEYLLNELKEKWECDTVEFAEEKLKKFRTKYQKLEDKIEEGLGELEKIMEND